jgi:hypothetical protein
LGVPQADIFGYSGGGSVALQLAIRQLAASLQNALGSAYEVRYPKMVNIVISDLNY